jgi:hypothetical protein
MHQLGITTDPTKRPSYGGQSGPLNAISNKSANLRSNQKQESYRPDVYKLSTVIETRRSMDSGLGASENIKSPNWAPTALPQPPPKDHRKLTKNRVISDNESERSLNHHTKTSSSSIDEDPMQIMVSKSFYITDEERSLASRDTPFR